MKDTGRPLYIRGHETVQVCLDGPALRVRRRGLDDRRFPLERVSRVVVIGEADWAPEALFACGDAGIVVCSIHPDGLPTWQWIGQPSSRSTFNEDWCHFLDRPGSRHAYRHWAAAERQRAIRFCALFLGLGRRGANHMLLRAGQWATMDSDMRTAKRGVYGLAHARCLEELAKLGLCNSAPSLGVVVPDLVAVIQWGLHPHLARDWCPSSTFEDIPRLVGLFERNRRTTEFHLRQVLRSLARLVGGA